MEQTAQIRVVMMPKDTNAMGSIFGGVILSYVDLAAAEAARTIAPRLFVTKIMREVDFIAPVHVGDTVTFSTHISKVGKTSVTVQVLVESERGLGDRERIKVTEAEVVMVAVDERGLPVTLKPRT